MKVLLTGATGLIGTDLTALLLKQNVAVNYLTTSKDKIVEKPNFNGFFWNPKEGIIDERAFQGVDAIVHLAGAPIASRWTKEQKQEIIESRIGSAKVIYDILKRIQHNVKQYVSASAIGIYPDSLEKVYTESDNEVAPNFPGQVVAKWESSADEFKSLNIKVCKIRTGLVLSNKSGFLFEMLKPIKLGFGAAFGSGRQMQSWIHLEDLVRMYAFAIQNGWDGIYNAAAPNPVANKELVRAIAKKIHKPFFMPNVPRWFMKLILGEMHLMLFTSQNVSGKKAIDNGFRFKFEFLRQALDDLL